MKITDFIPTGRENKIDSDTLADLCGLPDIRSLRAAIHALRVKGHVILSTTEGGGGYYLPSCPDEVYEYYRSMSSRAAETAKAAESAKRWIDENSGQLSMGV